MNKIQSLIILIVLLLVVGIGSFFSLNNNSEEKYYTKVLDTLETMKSLSKSDYIFETVKNRKIEMHVKDKKIQIKGMENKIVFLKVFGWNCKFCQKEIPELVKLKKRLGDSFEVVAIEAQQHTKEESLAQMKKYGINYHIVLGANQEEFYAYLKEKYGWTGIIPLTIVLSKSGDVLAFELGSKSYSLSELMKASLLRDQHD